jgi:D-glycero-alpha-D-manno-heptose-7-phosphate kinase
MIFASCPLRISLFGGSSDNPLFVEKNGFGTVISFASNLKTYITINRDKFGYNQHDSKYIINYSTQEKVSSISEIQNDPVRVVLDYFDMPPIQVTLASDIYSQGSGLASSSSFIISLIKACLLFNNEDWTDHEICKLAYSLEVKFNRYCGYQDPYGCGKGGFKKIDFFDRDTVKYEMLPNDLFQNYDMHLRYTGISRNSKKILKDISANLNKIKPLLSLAEDAYDLLKKNETKKILDSLSLSWKQKKLTTPLITKNTTVKKIDEQLSSDSSVLSHKLCGAGNGGFFLIFTEKDVSFKMKHTTKINVSNSGIFGKNLSNFVLS